MKSWIAALFIVLLVNTAYVAALASPTVFYMANVLGHVMLGAILAILVLFAWRSAGLRRAPFAVGLLLLACLLGGILAYAGNVRSNAWILWSHVGMAALGFLALIPLVRAKASLTFRRCFGVALIMLVALPLAVHGYKGFFPDPNDRIVNPSTAPLTMDGEGGGPNRRSSLPPRKPTRAASFPPTSSWTPRRAASATRTSTKQWKSSMHHFASFNNQFYRKAIEYMQDAQGTPRPASGAPAATITRCSSTAASTGPSASRSTPRKRRPAWLACPATPSCTWTAPWATPDSPSSTRPLHQLMTSKNPVIRALGRFPDLSESGAAPARLS